MNRRLLTILLPVAAASLAAGCTTFDTDSIARVGDDELDQELLDDLLSVLPNSAQSGPSDPANAEDVRQAIGIWVQSEIQSEVLAERDLAISEETIDTVTQQLSTQLPGFAELADPTRDLIVDFVAGNEPLTTNPVPASDELLDLYARGPAASDIICVSHVLVGDLDTANDVVARLADDVDFAEVAADASIDPGSAPNGGDLGCSYVSDFETQFVAEFVEGALDAELGEPTDPVESEFGFHVILLPEAGEVTDQLASFESDPRFLGRQADVSVDSRYGRFDPSVGGVVPLG